MTTSPDGETSKTSQAGKGSSAQRLVLPLALAQFIASYAGSNMNVAINAIATDLETTVRGVQTAITLFTLTMAALMIPGSKLTDLWGRKLCFRLGLLIYGAGALLATFATGIGVMVVGYSFLEGIGSALMIPPIYILITVWFVDVESRAKYFGVVSGAAGLGAAAGPLIGGLITSAVSWRASFTLQVIVVVLIIIMGRKIRDDRVRGPVPAFDLGGAILSAAGLFFVVLGVLQSGTYGWFSSRADFSIGGTVLIQAGGLSPVWLFVVAGAAILWGFFAHVKRREHKGKDPLLASRLFRNRVANLGLVTQNIQWLTLQGSFFVVSVFLQTVRHYDAIETGLILTASTVGVLLASAAAERMAKRRSQPLLIRSGFALTIVGTLLLLLLADATSPIATFLPGLFLMGVGIGVMLTASVNVVQSSFPEKDQGEISGLSRSISNLGSSLGTAIVGSVLVSSLVEGNEHFALAMYVMVGFSVVGLISAFLLPTQEVKTGKEI